MKPFKVRHLKQITKEQENKRGAFHRFMLLTGHYKKKSFVKKGAQNMKSQLTVKNINMLGVILRHSWTLPQRIGQQPLLNTQAVLWLPSWTLRIRTIGTKLPYSIESALLSKEVISTIVYAVSKAIMEYLTNNIYKVSLLIFVFKRNPRKLLNLYQKSKFMIK